LRSMIATTKARIMFIDTLEETRDPTLTKWKFREFLKQHLECLVK
jgi:hypothetical protein